MSDLEAQGPRAFLHRPSPGPSSICSSPCRPECWPWMKPSPTSSAPPPTSVSRTSRATRWCLSRRLGHPTRATWKPSHARYARFARLAKAGVTVTSEYPRLEAGLREPAARPGPRGLRRRPWTRPPRHRRACGAGGRRDRVAPARPRGRVDRPDDRGRAWPRGTAGGRIGWAVPPAGARHPGATRDGGSGRVPASDSRASGAVSAVAHGSRLYSRRDQR